jgi:hypothetical protein
MARISVVVTVTTGWRVAVIAAALVAGAAAAPAAAAPAASSPSWHLSTVFSTSSGVDEITSIDAVNGGEAWLAGETFPAASGQAPAIVERWSHGAWSPIPVPASVDPHGLTMAGNIIAASSETNAWMFSGYQGTAGPHEVALGWNGQQWTTHAFPLWSTINAAAVFSRTNVGGFGQVNQGPPAPLAVRYNGHAWRKVSVPVVPQGASAVSATDLWIVGPKVRSSAQRPVFAAARWDGRAWNEVTLPHLTLPAGAVLWNSDIVALARSDVWVTGWLAKGQGVFPGYVLLHLTAHGWSRVHVPFPPGSLTAITRDGKGGLEMTATAGVSQYFYHYLNGHWTRQQAPSLTGHTTQLDSISWAPGAPSGWASGEVLKGGNSQGAVLQSGP